MVKRVGKYEIGKTLGEGTFGKVKYAVNTETGEKVAIKILDKEKIQKQNMGAQIKKEISIMKMVKHPHVVKLYEVLASRSKIFIVLELIEGGELFDKIVASGRFNEDQARFYFRQLIKGVKYCHAQGVCHRDLKPENLLLDATGFLKISDFGLSALYTGSADDEGRATLLHTTCGTPNYVAPEVLNDKGYDGRAADVWSAGVILYVLLAGFLPFDEPHMSALFRKIQKAEFTYPSWFPADARKLIDRILIADPTRRASVAEIEADKWFIGPDGYKDEEVVAAAATATGDDVEEAVDDPEEGAGSAAAGGAAAAHTPASPAGGAAAKPVAAAAAASAAPAAATSSTSSSRPTGISVLNAFEVVNMFGGLALNRLLESGEKREKLLAVTPQFISAMPASTILMRITGAFASLGGEVTVDDKSFKVKGKFATASRGSISVIVQIFAISDSLHLVELKRGRGDIMEYQSIYTKMRELLADIVTKGSMARMTGYGATVAVGGAGSA